MHFYCLKIKEIKIGPVYAFAVEIETKVYSKVHLMSVAIYKRKPIEAIRKFHLFPLG